MGRYRPEQGEQGADGVKRGRPGPAHPCSVPALGFGEPQGAPKTTERRRLVSQSSVRQVRETPWPGGVRPDKGTEARENQACPHPRARGAGSGDQECGLYTAVGPGGKVGCSRAQNPATPTPTVTPSTRGEGHMGRGRPPTPKGRGDGRARESLLR